MRRGRTRKLGRIRKQRKALYKALTVALIEHGRIKTTSAKAKSLSVFADKLVNKAKNGNYASRQLIGRYLGDKVGKKLMTEISPKFKEINGGYTKVLKLGRRMSDGAEMSIIEFTK